MLKNLHRVKHLLLFNITLVKLQLAHKFKQEEKRFSDLEGLNVLKNGMEDDMLH